MKKILLVMAVASLAMVSCKKEYTCNCTFSETLYTNGTSTSQTIPATSGKTAKLSKSDAKTACEKSNGTITTGDTQNGSSVTTNCSVQS